MKVRLRTDISGTRNGEPWPSAGSEIDLPDEEAVALVRSGDARAVNTKDADVELREPPTGTPESAKRNTITRERQARSKRAHEPLNLGAADENQPAEDDNGPRLPEVNASESAAVESPSEPTQSEGGPSGDTAKPSEGKSSKSGK